MIATDTTLLGVAVILQAVALIVLCLGMLWPTITRWWSNRKLPEPLRRY